MSCEYGHGLCKAPDGECPHWQGIFCELDEENKGQTSVLYQTVVDIADKVEKYIKEHPEVLEEASRKYLEQFVDVKDIPYGDKAIMRDCHKCVYEVGCNLNPLGCKKYKRDAPDGGYYG